MFEGRPERSAEIVFVGRSNVGKSTLMREYTGHDFSVGRAPGVTRSPNYYDWESEDFLLTDLPGFGFMEGVDPDRREEIKTGIVRYLEEYQEHFLLAVLVVDGKSVIDIIDRHSDRGEVPYAVDMFGVLQELGVPTVIAVNKMDKVDDRDARLDAVADRFGMIPPWKQWRDVIAPVSAKKGQVEALSGVIRDELHEQSRDDLLKFFT